MTDAKLIWQRDKYRMSAADVAETSLGRFWTPRGWLHDPVSTRLVSHREVWEVHQIQAWPIHVATGLNKHGMAIELCLCTEVPGGRVALPTSPASGLVSVNHGICYHGPTLYATHGVGWWMNKGALVDGDTMFLYIQYRILKETDQ